jgi:hypothetical protein
MYEVYVKGEYSRLKYVDPMGQDFFEDVGDFFTGVGNTIVNGITSFMGAVGSGFGYAVNGIEAGIGAVVGLFNPAAGQAIITQVAENISRLNTGMNYMWNIAMNITDNPMALSRDTNINTILAAEQKAIDNLAQMSTAVHGDRTIQDVDEHFAGQAEDHIMDPVSNSGGQPMQLIGDQININNTTDNGKPKTLNDRADDVFYQLHPELSGMTIADISKNNPEWGRQLAWEWQGIKNGITSTYQNPHPLSEGNKDAFAYNILYQEFPQLKGMTIDDITKINPSFGKAISNVWNGIRNDLAKPVSAEDFHMDMGGISSVSLLEDPVFIAASLGVPELVGNAATKLGGVAARWLESRTSTIGQWAFDRNMYITASGSVDRILAQQATEAGSNGKFVKTFEQALEDLGKNPNFRPGQTVISKSRVMEIAENYNSSKAASSVYRDGNITYLVEGHHTTVATEMLGKDPGFNMNMITTQEPSAMNVYWSKNWYEFGKTSIKVVK